MNKIIPLTILSTSVCATTYILHKIYQDIQQKKKNILYHISTIKTDDLQKKKYINYDNTIVRSLNVSSYELSEREERKPINEYNYLKQNRNITSTSYLEDYLEDYLNQNNIAEQCDPFDILDNMISFLENHNFNGYMDDINDPVLNKIPNSDKFSNHSYSEHIKRVIQILMYLKLNGYHFLLSSNDVLFRDINSGRNIWLQHGGQNTYIIDVANVFKCVKIQQYILDYDIELPISRAKSAYK